MSPRPKTTAFFGTAALFLVLDQISKLIVRASLTPYKDEWVIVPNFLSIAHAKNTGAAFSAMDDWEYRYHVFFTLTAVAVVVLWQGYKQLRVDDRLQGAAMGFIMSGALGNFIDRVLFRAVTDMIKVQWGWEPGKSWLRDLPPLNSHVWPIFNIADSCIFIGLGLFAISFLYEKDRPAEEAEAVKAPGSSAPSLE
ncbi:MAG: signal peptidase II [Deltaproteobacteria bacterium]|nr:signal peptidase II [Deltaproteobacteria bacterium]